MMIFLIQHTLSCLILVICGIDLDPYNDQCGWLASFLYFCYPLINLSTNNNALGSETIIHKKSIVTTTGDYDYDSRILTKRLKTKIGQMVGWLCYVLIETSFQGLKSSERINLSELAIMFSKVKVLHFKAT